MSSNKETMQMDDHANYKDHKNGGPFNLDLK